MNLTPLKTLVTRRAQDAAVGMIVAGVGLAATQAANHVMPEAHLEGASMSFVLSLMADKPGANRAPVDVHRKHWSFGYGQLIFQEGGHWFYARRTRPSAQESGARLGQIDPGSPTTAGALVVRALTGGEVSLRALIATAHERFCPFGEVSLHTWEGHWAFLENKRPRPLSTVVVDGGLDQKLLADIQAFRADRAWYHQHHVPYRRGYLLHGPPGSGKSTLAGAVAGEAGLHVCILSLNHEGLTDTVFAQALRQMPQNSMLLLEDVDAVNAQTERRVDAGWDASDIEVTGADYFDLGQLNNTLTAMTHRPAGKLTLAGILNALDGLGTPDGLIVMMTTNHREALDPALIRPGRVDRQFYVGMASQDQAERMYARFFPEGVEHGWHESFANTLIGEEHSPAALQEHLVRHRGDPLGALTNKVGA